MVAMESFFEGVQSKLQRLEGYKIIWPNSH